MKSKMLFFKKFLPMFVLLVLASSSMTFAMAAPTRPEDVPFFVQLLKFLGFAGLVVSALILGSAGLRWAILHFKSLHEDDPAKLSEYESLTKKAMKFAVLGLGTSIVSAILAFFV